MTPTKPGVRSIELPYLCRIWGSIHKSPAAGVRSFLWLEIDVLTIIFSAVFWLLNVLTYQFLVVQLNWPDGIETSRAAAYCVGCFHTSNIVPPLAQWLHWAGYETNAWKTWTCDAEKHVLYSLISFSRAYFIYDSIYNLLYVRYWLYDEMNNDEWLFFVHHIVCILAFSGALRANEGHQFTAIFTLCAEITNPFDNMVAFADVGLHLSPGSFLQSLHDNAKVILSLLYFGVRGVLCPFFLMPLFTLQLGKELGGPRTGTALFRFSAMWGIELGSIAWVMQCYRFLRQAFWLSAVAASSIDAHEDPSTTSAEL